MGENDQTELMILISDLIRIVAFSNATLPRFMMPTKDSSFPTITNYYHAIYLFSVMKYNFVANCNDVNIVILFLSSGSHKSSFFITINGSPLL